MMGNQILQFAAIVIGSALISVSFGYQLGLGIGLISWALMPVQR